MKFDFCAQDCLRVVPPDQSNLAKAQLAGSQSKDTASRLHHQQRQSTGARRTQQLLLGRHAASPLYGNVLPCCTDFFIRHPSAHTFTLAAGQSWWKPLNSLEQQVAEVADAVSRLEDDVRSLRSELAALIKPAARMPLSSPNDTIGAYRNTYTYPYWSLRLRSAAEVGLSPC